MDSLVQSRRRWCGSVGSMVRGVLRMEVMTGGTRKVVGLLVEVWGVVRISLKKSRNSSPSPMICCASARVVPSGRIWSDVACGADETVARGSEPC